jgi:hypothetical protein
VFIGLKEFQRMYWFNILIKKTQHAYKIQLVYILSHDILDSKCAYNYLLISQMKGKNPIQRKRIDG